MQWGAKPHGGGGELLSLHSSQAPKAWRVQLASLGSLPARAGWQGTLLWGKSVEKWVNCFQREECTAVARRPQMPSAGTREGTWQLSWLLEKNPGVQMAVSS